MKAVCRLFTTLSLFIPAFSGFAQGDLAISSILVTPAAEEEGVRKISLTIDAPGTDGDLVLEIEGSADLENWEPIDQITAGKSPFVWEEQRSFTSAHLFYRVKKSEKDDALADGLYAEITTSKGVMLAKLEDEKTPLIVANFIGLAEGTKFYTKTPGTPPVDFQGKPFYDGLIFHRVIKDFMIQGGCALGNGTSNPGYWLPDQFHPTLKHNGPGILSMANSGEHTNGSQFFITHKATPWLDKKHSVFGKVIRGLEVVDAIAGVVTGIADKPVDGVTIESIRIIRKGTRAQAFDGNEATILNILRENADAWLKAKGEELKIDLTDSGILYEELEAGTGSQVKASDTVTFHYKAELPTNVNESGRLFANSFSTGQPLKIGVDDLLPGIYEGLKLMKQGGRAILYIPPALAWGEQGIYAARVPANSVVIMEIHLLEVTPGD